MECRYKKFFVKCGKATTGECDRTYPACLKEIGVCGYEEKFTDLYLDARSVARELAEERGEYE